MDKDMSTLVLLIIGWVGAATVFYILLAILFELYNYDYANIIIPIVHH